MAKEDLKKRALNAAEVDDDNDEDADSMQNRFLTFRIADEEYGIEIRHVVEIVGIQKIATLPDMPDFVRGVINLRGQVIPVMDVRMRFRLTSRDYDERTCVIVVQVQDCYVGLVVDTVKEVVDIRPDMVSDPPRVGSGTTTRYLKGVGRVGDEVKILIDVDKLLFEEEMAALSGLAGSAEGPSATV